MNAKKAKKLRWYARAQEAIMPAPVVNKEGIPSTLLVYNHPKVWKDKDDNEHTFVNRTLQYNPRTSVRGSTRRSKVPTPTSKEHCRMSGSCVSRGSSSAWRRSTQEKLEPLPALPDDLRWLWADHLLGRHLQMNLWDNNPLQLEFEFGYGDT